ncbi:hypothetical protein DP117_02765 [Brasilonema sp. UFV-L1]|nr:hypothetical protein [Brasilonema sp. UFV-L1]
MKFLLEAALLAARHPLLMKETLFPLHPHPLSPAGTLRVRPLGVRFAHTGEFKIQSGAAHR